jgi:autoinducer 2-degrading protein
MYVVTVLFEIHPQHTEEFRSLVLMNATASLKENGCHRFDVSFSEDGLRCFLYEFYGEKADFQTHLSTPHFKEFELRAKSLVTSKKVDTFLLVNAPV